MNSDREILANVQGQSGELQLQRRGGHYEVISNGTFLMATHNGESERRMVQEAMNHAYSAESVLIGGLGVGFSLHEAVQHTETVHVTVVELEKHIIEWNRLYFQDWNGRALENSKAQIVEEDLQVFLEKGTNNRWGVVCMDTDNGPDWLVREDNQHMYEAGGLQTIYAALRCGGVAAFWSASYSRAFENILKAVFDTVWIEEVGAGRGGPDVIFYARKAEHMHSSHNF
ncbi:spermidine synthase [Marinococcus luteus]|uniref:spermidine synthase n=1 Tax=Marinococcus luteus TaxID=1122204 RepID=UPI002ACCC83F|nr:spermine/spermidine synthase [Marinococcus luteus]MDZ5783987.1 spermine/spermidine synthase [Marinococcus luteus]